MAARSDSFHIFIDRLYAVLVETCEGLKAYFMLRVEPSWLPPKIDNLP